MGGKELEGTMYMLLEKGRRPVVRVIFRRENTEILKTSDHTPPYLEALRHTIKRAHTQQIHINTHTYTHIHKHTGAGVLGISLPPVDVGHGQRAIKGEVRRNQHYTLSLALSLSFRAAQ